MKVNTSVKVADESAQTRLRGAILLYELQCNDRDGGSPGQYATLHKVGRNASGRPMIESGRPMTSKDYADMLANLHGGKSSQLTWVDTRSIAVGHDVHLWWTAARTKAMFFEDTSNNVVGSAPCPVPAMVWMLKRETLYVFALACHERPQPDTPVYQAPFFNVDADGEVCYGTAAPPSTQLCALDAWEAMFFESRFSHPNGMLRGKLIHGSELKFWRNMLAKPTDTFPTNVLRKTRWKVRDLINIGVSQ